MIGAEITIAGPRPLRGTLRVPGDKGISHRALLSAALASGRSTIRGLADGDDVQHTRAALEQLAVRVKDSEPSTAMVLGTGAAGLREPDAVIDCGNSGTTMRMLAGVLAGRPFLSVLSGDSSLQGRPMGRVARPLRALGARVDGRADGELAPLVIRGGGLTARRIELDVVSAQVKTAVILAGLQAQGATEVVEPAPSRDHTERMLEALRAPVTHVDDRTTRVETGAPTPFELDEYAVPELEQSTEADARADAKYQEALRNNQRGDNYTILTIAFASVLFFTAMATRMRRRRTQWVLLTIAAVGFVATSAFLASFPKLV